MDIFVGVLVTILIIGLIIFITGTMTIAFLEFKQTLKRDYGINLTKKKND